MTALLVFVLQVIFSVVRSANIRYIIHAGLLKKVLITVFSTLIWLVILYLGIGSMLKGEYIVVVAYVVGAAVGVVIDHYIDLYEKKKVHK